MLVTLYLFQERKFGQPVESNELFMVTHTKNNGFSVDSRA